MLAIGAMERQLRLACLLLATCCLIIHAEVPPRFIEEPRTVIAKHHTKIVMRCEVEPKSADIRWIRNDKYINTNLEQGIEIEGGVLIVLSFKHTKKFKHHVGTYQCVANNTAGAIRSKPAQLLRAAIGHFKASADVYINATEGNVAVVPCDPPSGEPFSITVFEVNSTTIDRSTDHHKLMPSGSLQISRVKPSDQGVYRCISINPVSGKKRTAKNKVILKVLAPTSNSPPLVTQGPKKNYEVVAGSNLTLECVVSGSPVPTVSWNKYGGQLPEGRYSQVLGNLIIHRTKVHDQGTYICQADNGFSPSPTVITSVDVLEPPKMTYPPVNKETHIGGTVTFDCVTENGRGTHTTWLHNAKQVFSDTFMTVTDTSLTISNAQLSHQGLYQCIVKNKVGQTSAVASFRIVAMATTTTTARIPSDHIIQNVAPDNRERAEHGDDDEARKTTPSPLSFSSKDPDSFNVDTPRGSHLARNTTSTQARPVGMTTRPDSEGGARGETSGGGRRGHHGRRRKNKKKKKNRKNNNNNGPESSSLPVITETETRGSNQMIPPTKPLITQLSDTSVMLAWTVPANDGYRITFFKVQYKEITGDRHRSRWRTIDEDIQDNIRRYEVSGLKPGGMYRFRIAAVYSNNDNKLGANSDKFRLRKPSKQEAQRPVAGPVIVDARPIATDALIIRWQYLQVDGSPIEGFIIYYKPYGSNEEYQKQRVMGASQRNHIIRDLLAKTQYTIKMQCFNNVGKSDYSNSVVKSTLSDDSQIQSPDYPPVPFPDPDIPDHLDHLTTKKPISKQDEYEEDETTMNTHSSSEMLYMILGIVLGVMMLLLVVFMVMCGWKQRQQRRMMAALNANVRKFQDPARNIHNESLRKKQMNGGFALNGIAAVPNGKVGNGHLPQHHHHSNGKMNISINPLTELDSQGVISESDTPKPNTSTQDLNGSIHDILPPPPPIIMGETYSSTERSRNHHNSQQNSIDGVNRLDHNNVNTNHRNRNEPMGTDVPPDYNSLNRSNDQLPRSHDHLNRSFDHVNRSHDHIPRSHDHINRSRDHIHRSRDHLSANEQSPSQVANKHKRRRRRHQNREERGGMRDQATNTDLSSNEGTLDYRSPYRSTDGIRQDSPPLATHNAPQFNDFPSLNHYPPLDT